MSKQLREIRAILCNIRSLHNVGSMFRTADGAGLSKLYLCGITPAPTDKWGKSRQQLVKVSLGAEQFVPWEEVRSCTALIKKLKKEGYTILAVEQSDNAILYSSPKIGKLKKSKIAFIVGNEITGLPPVILHNVDYSIEIPMRGKKESLNVSVAFGIIAYALQCEK